MNWRTFSIICVLASYPSVAVANPSPVAGPYGQFIGLFVETLLIAIILGSKGFDPIRFFYSWGLVSRMAGRLRRWQTLTSATTTKAKYS